jgi:hypothetical protein
VETRYRTNGAPAPSCPPTADPPVDGTAPDVQLLAWPADAARVAELRLAARPRLLVVEPGAAPPTSADLLEDWVRSPADPDELAIRRATLADRARRRRPAPVATLDDDGILRFAGAWLALPPLEVRLLAPLLARAGGVVRRGDLVRAAWPDGPPGDPRALDVRVKVLRRRLAPLGLGVHTVAQRGYLLEVPVGYP